MQRPLLALALLHVTGILCANLLPLPLPTLLAGTFIIATLALLLPTTRHWCYPPLLILTGATNFAVHTSEQAPHSLNKQFTHSPHSVSLRATLVSPPKERIVNDQGFTLSSVELNVTSTSPDSRDWKPASGKILASVPGTLPWHSGQEVEVSGVLSPPGQAAAPGLFDYRAHLKRKSIHHLLKTDSTNNWSLTPASRTLPPPLDHRFRHWARQTLANGLPDDDPQVELLWAMTLGWRTALTGEVAEPFMRSGTLHVFAISGLHIGLIAGILVSLLRVLSVPRPFCGLILIPALWFYAFATGGQPSAVRATMMMSVIVAGWSLRRPADLINSLSAAALLLLLLDPQQLFLPGFQLSFSVVASIALFVPLLEHQRQRLLQPDPFQLPNSRSRWKRWMDKATHGFTTTAVTSFAAWIGSIPMAAFYFNFFTPVALLANLAIIPLAGLALMSTLGSLATGAWLTECSILFNHSAWLWMKLMILLSEQASELPGAWHHVPRPSLSFFLLYYGSLLTLTQGWHKSRHRRRVCTLLAAPLLVCCVELFQSSRHPHLSILPLNGGEALYLNYPGHKNDCLIDCGNASTARQVTLPFLKLQGVNRLPRLFLTHGDIRNVGGVREFNGTIEIEKITFSPVRFRSAAYRKLREQIKTTPRFEETQRGNFIDPWSILHPAPTDRFSQADDSALVLQATFNSTRVLLLSDLGRHGQSTLLNRQTNLQAHILICGLPRASAPAAPELLDAVHPDLIIVTDSNYPADQRAGRDFISALRRRGCQTLYTRQCGGITLTFHADGWRLVTARGDTLNSVHPSHGIKHP